MMIVNDDASVVNKLEASPSDNAGVVIYDRHMFIVQATELLGLSNVLYFGLSGFWTEAQNKESQK